MGITYNFLNDIVKPEGFEKENINKIYRAIASVFDIVSNDYKTTVNNYFAFIADEESLEKHRVSADVIKFPVDSDDEVRKRVSGLFEYYSQLGEKNFLISYLEAFFKDRYSFIEVPKNSWYMGFKQLGFDTYLYSIRGFRIYIDDITEQEKKTLGTFLHISLETDIEYKIFMRNQIITQLGWRIGSGILGIDTYLLHGGI